MCLYGAVPNNNTKPVVTAGDSYCALYVYNMQELIVRGLLAYSDIYGHPNNYELFFK